MGLPVLRLPHVIFDNIYQSLDVSDKILLSQCSRRMKALVKSQEGPRTGLQIAIHFYRDSTIVQVVRRISDSSNPTIFTLHVYPVRNRELTEKSFFHLNIDGTTCDVKKCRTLGSWYCVPEEGCYEKAVLTIVRMLRDVLNCSISNVCYSRPCANFQKLFVETDALHRADQIFVADGIYSPKEMTFTFDHFVTDSLYFWGYCSPKYNYQNPWNFPKIHLDHAAWVNLEKVFEMTKTGRNVSLYGAKPISDKDINQFIKWWLTSDNKTLEYLTIARGELSTFPQPPRSPEVAMNRSVIMEGIESTPGKKKRDEAIKNILCDIEWENGLDIIREDGVQATILVNHLASYDKFIFAVWHHPNPNVEEVINN